MMKKLTRWVYRVVAGLVRLFYRRPEVVGAQNLPPEPCIIVGNHAQMNGPIVAELYLPGAPWIWCSAEMMHLKEVPAYAYADFWSKKPRGVRWFYCLLSYVIAPLSVCVFNNARCIGVYRDGRVMGTLRASMERMDAGSSIVIFPEHEVPHNSIVWDFQEGFVNLARMYARRTDAPVCFVPMYVAPALGRVFLGEPVRYDTSAPPEDERRRVCQALMDAITAMAVAQPKHRVVPYPNLPRRAYPWNVPDEERP